MKDEEAAADGSLVVVRDAQGQAGLQAGKAFAIGEVVSRFGAREERREPDYLTVQVGPGRHITLDPPYLQYTNHSCEPNVLFDTARGEIVALAEIAPGDAITFFYPSTEWAMDRPFACLCGTPSCLGTIAGASQLDPAQLAGFRLAPHIAEMLDNAEA